MRFLKPTAQAIDVFDVLFRRLNRGRAFAKVEAISRIGLAAIIAQAVRVSKANGLKPLDPRRAQGVAKGETRFREADQGGVIGERRAGRAGEAMGTTVMRQEANGLASVAKDSNAHIVAHGGDRSRKIARQQGRSKGGLRRQHFVPNFFVALRQIPHPYDVTR
jgi:hypothetical protein